MNKTKLLLQLCGDIYRAIALAEKERKAELFGGNFGPELLVMRKDKIRVEIRKETVRHHAPHMHVSHSDKFDASINLITLDVIEGEIDSKIKKNLINVLKPKQKELLEIWNELNEKDNSIGAEKLISNLGF